MVRLVVAAAENIGILFLKAESVLMKSACKNNARDDSKCVNSETEADSAAPVGTDGSLGQCLLFMSSK